MCGIAGYIGTRAIDMPCIRRTLRLMRHRGPDHRDWCIARRSAYTVLLLHSRLAIVDCDRRSNQPFTIADYSIVFNGEIYNHLEIRSALEARGALFRTRSDTEVLLRSYLVWGSACVERFEGMWAFAIHDRRRNAVLLSRDRFGEKPLYYLPATDGLFFGSETRFISALCGSEPQVNVAHLRRFLVNGYKCLYKTPDTFFRNVHRVPAGCHLWVTPAGDAHIERYWRPVVRPRRMALDEAIEGLRARLEDSLRLRLRADVPVAFCLSGGVDSGALASIASKRLHTDVSAFSLSDRDERYDERDNIRATARDLRCRHTWVEIPRARSFERLARLIRYHDAPVYTISYYIHAILMEQMAARGVRVAVSGTAADELFTGYYDHFNLHLYEMREHSTFAQLLEAWKRGPGQWVRNPYLQDPCLYHKCPEFRNHIYLNRDAFLRFLTADFAEPFEEEQYCDGPLRNRMLNELFHEATPAILHEEDLNCMSASIENRSPYLDSRLFDFACSIPAEHLIRDGLSKYVLREAVRDVLNERVRLTRRKIGFNAAFRSVFDVTAPCIRECLAECSALYDLVDRKRLQGLLSREELPNSYSKFLFRCISTGLFLQQRGSGYAGSGAVAAGSARDG